MPPPEVHLLFHQPIADHSFSADRSRLAVARDSRVQLYARSGKGFTLEDELAGHDKTVTSVDIAPQSGKIVTCSQGAFAKLGCTLATVSSPRTNPQLQIVTPSSGSPPRPAGSPRSSFSASTVLRHRSAGPPTRTSSPPDPERA